MNRAVDFPSEWRVRSEWRGRSERYAASMMSPSCKLVLRRYPAAESGMQALSIVEHLNVVEHPTLASSRVQKRLWWTCSTLSAASKLSMGVVEAVPASAHGLNNGMSLQHDPIGLDSALHV